MSALQSLFLQGVLRSVVLPCSVMYISRIFVVFADKNRSLELVKVHTDIWFWYFSASLIDFGTILLLQSNYLIKKCLSDKEWRLYSVGMQASWSACVWINSVFVRITFVSKVKYQFILFKCRSCFLKNMVWCLHKNEYLLLFPLDKCAKKQH